MSRDHSADPTYVRCPGKFLQGHPVGLALGYGLHTLATPDGLRPMRFESGPEATRYMDGNVQDWRAHWLIMNLGTSNAYVVARKLVT